MWKFIIAACIIGGIVGFFTARNPFSGAVNGAVKGGCFAVGCIIRVILGIILFGLIALLFMLL